MKNIFLILIVWAFSVESHAIQHGHRALGTKYGAVVGIENCTAVVIHPSVLLTAAHCTPFLYRGPNKYYPSGRGQAETIEIKEIYIHEGFEPKEGPNNKLKVNDDLALVVLRQPLENKSVLASIPKLSDNQNPIGEKFEAVGLGFYRQGPHSYLGDGDNSDKRFLGYRVLEARSSVLFIMSNEKSAGICGGDSGGALYIDVAEGGGYRLAGILTAISHYCGNNDEFSYAESVAHQRAWIDRKLALENITL